MQLIDTHGHLNLSPLTDDWEAVVQRCRERGVAAIVLPGTNLTTSQRAIELAAARPGFLFAGVGVHPTWFGGRISEIGDQIPGTFDIEPYRQLARQSEVVAVGEVGLDTYRVQIQNSKFKSQNDKLKIPATAGPRPGGGKIGEQLRAQEQVLHEFIGIAQKVNKPLIFHCRGAKRPESRIMNQESGDAGFDVHDRLLQILTETAPRPKFVVHCYQGTVAQVERYLALGGLISFTGTITYTDDPAVTDVVRAVPLGRLMIETDSPFLSPVPYRGETNEPWKVVEVARRVAELKGLTVEKVAAATTENAARFFGLSFLGENEISD